MDVKMDTNKSTALNANKRQIVLIRHGRPKSAHNELINAVNYKKWVHDYDRSELDPNSVPRVKVDLDPSYIIASPLLRAKLSAQKYGVIRVDEHCEYLKEMDIPYYKVPFISLRAWQWVVVSRFLWFLGVKGYFESFKEAKRRVVKLADHVESLSEDHQRIILFGHGMIHYFTRKELIKRGWLLTQKNSDFWGITSLERSE